MSVHGLKSIDAMDLPVKQTDVFSGTSIMLDGISDDE